MPDYREIYDEIYAREENYRAAQHSPGFLTCVRATEKLRALKGRALDYGCGVGFAVEYLSQRPFQLQCWGVDISPRAIAEARRRISGSLDRCVEDRLTCLEAPGLPFDDGFFNLVTCFDVLEHLDAHDIDLAIAEMNRVLRRGGIWFGSVSCRSSGSQDRHGDNLHRTVRNVDWWIQRIAPDVLEFDTGLAQLTLWKRQRKRPSQP